MSHGTQGIIGAGARSRYKLLQNCQESRIESKNRDKLITPTVRVIVSKVKRTGSVMVNKLRFAKRWQKLADGAHRPVLQISRMQNRELPYASAWLEQTGLGGTNFQFGKRTTDHLYTEF